jgi:hypothetical protein
VRRRRVSLTVLTTLLLSLLGLGLAGSATAGGPTSVLLVVPGEGRTAALYNDNPDYQELADLVGAFGTSTGSSTPPAGADDQGASGTNDASGPGVTVTWLMHDVNVWRVDRIYLKAEGGPLISTQSTTDDGDLWSEPALWHSAAARGKPLTELLDRLGVGNTGSPAGPVPSAPAAQAGTGGGAESDRSGGTAAGWIWGPAGLLVGIALTLAALRWRTVAAGTGGRTPEPGPEPEAEPDAGSGSGSGSGSNPIAETLSSH